MMRVGHSGSLPSWSVRVAIIAECFLPECNGVTNSVLRVLEHLGRSGHEAMVVAPGLGPDRYLDVPVERVPSVRLPVYRSLAVGLPTARVQSILRAFSPDVVHLAAPVVLGAAGGRAARAIGVPAVSVYQTDLAGVAHRYGWGVASPAVWAWLRRVHNQTALTLAPSTLSAWQLEGHGITPVARWGRGVDLTRFHPGHRDVLLNRRLGHGGGTVVGYMGRLAVEKQVHLLAHLRALPGAQVVVIGDGPARVELQRRLPGVTFLGFLTGEALSQALASLDVFVHTGADETFCQAIQEALASGVPVVAPASGGPMDLVRHGENGYLYPAGDSALLRGAVRELVGDPRLRHTMGARARASVEHRSWSDLGDELLGHYCAVTGIRVRRQRAA